MSLSKFSRQYRAVDFYYGGPQDGAPAPLVVASAPGASGAQTVTVYGGTIALSDGTVVTPFATTAPVTIGSAGNQETVTPSAVSTNVWNQTIGATATLTATFSNAHYAGERITSGTAGLQEALNYCSAQGGGTVIVDAGWVSAGGTSTILSAATIPSGVVVLDNRSGQNSPIMRVVVPLTLAQIQGAYTTAVSVLPAPGAGNAYDIIDATLNLVYGSAAYSGGGAAALYYGTDNTGSLATATWAATDFTSLSANQLHKVAGAAATAASSTYINKAIVYSNATALFTVGTGGSGKLYVTYRVMTGLS